MRCTIVIDKMKLDEVAVFIQYISVQSDDWFVAEVESIEIE